MYMYVHGVLEYCKGESLPPSLPEVLICPPEFWGVPVCPPVFPRKIPVLMLVVISCRYVCMYAYMYTVRVGMCCCVLFLC